MKTILITGIGGLTPRSIATIIKEKYPDYKLIGCDNVVRDQYQHYDKPYIFLRDVDVEPIILESEGIFDDPAYKI